MTIESGSNLPLGWHSIGLHIFRFSPACRGRYGGSGQGRRDVRLGWGSGDEGSGGGGGSGGARGGGGGGLWGREGRGSTAINCCTIRPR